MPNYRLSKEKRKKIWGAMQLALLYVKQFKKKWIMETVELSFKDWMSVYCALDCKREQLKIMGLEELAEDIERIRARIREQIV
jgi:3'-phosphoadenosine 5'-phosphosulfate sulfotransferase